MIFDHLWTYKADIIFLQETHNDSETNEQLWAQEWGGQCLWSRGTNRSCGVAILFKPGQDYSITRILRDHEGRMIAATVSYQNSEVNLMNIYSPNNLETGKRTSRTYGNTSRVNKT